MITDAALVRTSGIVELHTIAFKNLQTPIVHLYGNRNPNLPIRMSDTCKKIGRKRHEGRCTRKLRERILEWVVHSETRIHPPLKKKILPEVQVGTKRIQCPHRSRKVSLDVTFFDKSNGRQRTAAPLHSVLGIEK